MSYLILFFGKITLLEAETKLQTHNVETKAEVIMQQRGGNLERIPEQLRHANMCGQAENTSHKEKR